MGDLNISLSRYNELRSAIFADVSRNLNIDLLQDDTFASDCVRNEGVGFVLRRLTSLGKALDHALITGRFVCVMSFKKKRHTELPIFLYRMFSRILHDDGTLRESACPDTIRYLRQILLLNKKLVVPYEKKSLTEFWNKFKAQQEKLLSFRITFPEFDDAQCVLERFFSYYFLETLALEPKHGPGAVAERFRRDEKWTFRSWPKKLERLFPYLQYGALNIADAIRSQSGVPLVASVTRGCFVPKDIDKPRFISIEPAAMQYVQQGMLRKLDLMMQDHPLTRGFVDMHDQELNRAFGSVSYERGYSTIDFSSASDTISLFLVRHLLAKVPYWRSALCRLRSDKVSFEGDTTRLVAFSPMGSAICFPIQTLVFWSIAISVVMKIRRLGIWEARKHVRVFGDDVIIPNDCVDRFLAACSSVGMEPNTEKCCISTPFRETCGGEWFNGHDVSIYKNKWYPFPENHVASNHPVLVQLQRGLYSQRLYSAADLVYSWCNQLIPTIRTEDRSDAYVCLGPHSTKGVVFKYDSDIQVVFYRTFVEMSKRQKWSDNLSFEALRASLVSSSYDDRFAQRTTQVVKRAWRRCTLDSNIPVH